MLCGFVISLFIISLVIMYYFFLSFSTIIIINSELVGLIFFSLNLE